EHHWRSSQYSTEIIRCNNNVACQPSQENLQKLAQGQFEQDLQCADGYTGPICGSCLRDDYGSPNMGLCYKCPSVIWNIIYWAFTGSFEFILCCLAIVTTLESTSVNGISTARPVHTQLIKVGESAPSSSVHVGDPRTGGFFVFDVAISYQHLDSSHNLNSSVPGNWLED
ncbi:hypothetical protein CYMTET_36633, partial [Cymbomonas tetramitiformis]